MLYFRQVDTDMYIGVLYFRQYCKDMNRSYENVLPEKRLNAVLNVWCTISSFQQELQYTETDIGKVQELQERYH